MSNLNPMRGEVIKQPRWLPQWINHPLKLPTHQFEGN